MKFTSIAPGYFQILPFYAIKAHQVFQMKKMLVVQNPVLRFCTLVDIIGWYLILNKRCIKDLIK